MNKWLRVQNSNWQKKGLGALMSFWPIAVKAMVIMLKVIAVTLPSSYSVSFVKELHNALIAITCCVAKCFGKLCVFKL